MLNEAAAHIPGVAPLEEPLHNVQLYEPARWAQPWVYTAPGAMPLSAERGRDQARVVSGGLYLCTPGHHRWRGRAEELNGHRSSRPWLHDSEPVVYGVRGNHPASNISVPGRTDPLRFHRVSRSVQHRMHSEQRSQESGIVLFGFPLLALTYPRPN